MICTVNGCNSEVLGNRPFCMKHYTQVLRHGKIVDRTRYSLNTWKKVSEGYLFDLYDKNGQLRQEKFLVDEESFEIVKKYKWGFHGPYISNKKLGLIHRFLMKPPKGKCVDHKNGDTRDNRICNLRVCSPRDNRRNANTAKNNTSGYSGVTVYRHNRSKFVAMIEFSGKKKYLGIHNTATEAARAYNEAATKYFGEFARLNIIKEES